VWNLEKDAEWIEGLYLEGMAVYSERRASDCTDVNFGNSLVFLSLLLDIANFLGYCLQGVLVVLICGLKFWM
jgi:hypothetical protein